MGKLILQYILDRAKEPSTWKGLAVVATSTGIAITPDQMNAVISIGLAVAGFIDVITKEKM